jgi:hypothetical protein
VDGLTTEGEPKLVTVADFAKAYLQTDAGRAFLPVRRAPAARGMGAGQESDGASSGDWHALDWAGIMQRSYKDSQGFLQYIQQNPEEWAAKQRAHAEAVVQKGKEKK